MHARLCHFRLCVQQWQSVGCGLLHAYKLHEIMRWRSGHQHATPLVTCSPACVGRARLKRNTRNHTTSRKQFIAEMAVVLLVCASSSKEEKEHPAAGKQGETQDTVHTESFQSTFSGRTMLTLVLCSIIFN